MKAISKMVMVSLFVLVVFIAGCTEQQVNEKDYQPTGQVTTPAPQQLEPSLTIGQQAKQSDALIEAQLAEMANQDTTDLQVLENELLA